VIGRIDRAFFPFEAAWCEDVDALDPHRDPPAPRAGDGLTPAERAAYGIGDRLPADRPSRLRRRG
jgi:hypothetical protein